jgi:hypothetical protein
MPIACDLATLRATLPRIQKAPSSPQGSRFVPVVIVAIVAAVVGLFLVGPAVMTCFCSSKKDVAYATVKSEKFRARILSVDIRGGNEPRNRVRIEVGGISAFEATANRSPLGRTMAPGSARSRGTSMT